MGAIDDDTNCRDTIVRCIRSLDGRDYEQMAACFAENGVWERGGEKLRGPREVRAALDKRPADLQTQHLISNMVIDSESDGHVIAKYSLTAYAQRGNAPMQLHAIFKAEDRLVKEPGGWRFLLRSATPAFSPHD